MCQQEGHNVCCSVVLHQTPNCLITHCKQPCALSGQSLGMLQSNCTPGKSTEITKRPRALTRHDMAGLAQACSALLAKAPMQQSFLLPELQRTSPGTLAQSSAWMYCSQPSKMPLATTACNTRWSHVVAGHEPDSWLRMCTTHMQVAAQVLRLGAHSLAKTGSLPSLWHHLVQGRARGQDTPAAAMTAASMQSNELAPTAYPRACCKKRNAACSGTQLLAPLTAYHCIPA